MNDLEAKAELVQFAREEHNKLQARIRELEARLKHAGLEVGKLLERNTRAKAILDERSSTGHLVTNTMRVKAALSALEGK